MIPREKQPLLILERRVVLPAAMGDLCSNSSLYLAMLKMLSRCAPRNTPELSTLGGYLEGIYVPEDGFLIL